MIYRVHTTRLVEMLNLFPVVAVIGPRQVGKSTLVLSEEIARGRRYTTLDDLTSRTLAERDPLALLDQTSPITIDEIQLHLECREEAREPRDESCQHPAGCRLDLYRVGHV